MEKVRSAFGAIHLALFLLLSVFAVHSCGDGKSKVEKTPEEIRLDSINAAIEDSIKAAIEDSVKTANKLVNSEDKYPLIKYNQVIIKDIKHLREIRKKYNHPKDFRAGWKTIMTLNRKEWRYIRKGQLIVIPDTIVDDIKAYSIFPQYYPGAKDIRKILLVSNAYQCYGAYEYGKLVRFAAVNSGKEKTPTFPGRYALVWKERVRRSSLDSNWIMPFTFNFHGEAGNAFHQFTMPGYPASHSCMRQFMDDAEWLFFWGEGQKLDANKKRIYMSGTPVIVLDYYDYSRGHKGPWRDIKSNKDKVITLPEDPMAVEEALIPMCQIPVSARGRLVNRSRFKNAEKVLRERGVIREHVVLTPTFNFNDKRRREQADSIKKAQASASQKKDTSSVKPKVDSKNKTKEQPDKKTAPKNETVAPNKPVKNKPVENKTKEKETSNENPPD